VPLDGGNVSGGGDNLLELPLLETHWILSTKTI
jgi:hypothetical protein